MSLTIGIVGLPNVGKSTLFKALTSKQIDIANYPFCTIEPNVGVVTVPDERLTALAAVSKSAKIVPTVIEFLDIAGLVKGASTGEGLGNKFLANIREVDAIVQVVRAFADDDIVHVAGHIDPAEDIRTINVELMLADLETVGKHLAAAESKTKSGMTHELTAQLALLRRVRDALTQEVLISTLTFTDDEWLYIKTLNLLTSKPMIYVVNVSEAQVAEPVTLSGISPDRIVPICAKVEAELSELPATERVEYLQSLGLTQSGLDQLIVASYRLLNLLTFLTSGEAETRAWTVTAGSTAPQAAGKIHTDFERGFIRAEICDWKDFVAYGEVGCREKGLMRIEGKDYIMRDGDVCHFRFNV